MLNVRELWARRAHARWTGAPSGSGTGAQATPPTRCVFGITACGHSAIGLEFAGSAEWPRVAVAVEVSVSTADGQRRAITLRAEANELGAIVAIIPDIDLDRLCYAEVRVASGEAIRLIPPAPSQLSRMQWHWFGETMLLTPGDPARIRFSPDQMRLHDERCATRGWCEQAASGTAQQLLRDEARVCRTCVPRPPRPEEESDNE